MKCVLLDVECVHLLIGNLHPRRIQCFVDSRLDGQALSCPDVGDEAHDDLVAGQRRSLYWFQEENG